MGDWVLKDLADKIWIVMQDSSKTDCNHNIFEVNLLENSFIQTNLEDTHIEIHENCKNKQGLSPKHAIYNKYWYLRHSSFLELYILDSEQTLNGMVSTIRRKRLNDIGVTNYIDTEAIISLGFGVIVGTTGIDRLLQRFDTLKAYREKLIRLGYRVLTYDEIELELILFTSGIEGIQGE